MSAMSALLISRPSDEYLQSAWVAAVLPLASDPEQTCQVRVLVVNVRKPGIAYMTRHYVTTFGESHDGTFRNFQY